MFKMCGVLSIVLNLYLCGVMVFLQVLQIQKANVRRILVVKVTVIVMIPSIGKDERKRKERGLHLKRKQTELKSLLLS